MNKVIEEFTGTIGVGFLVSLGLFFFTDSQYYYWPAIEELMGTNSWSVMVSIPILIVNYILGLIIIEISEIIFPLIFAKDIQDVFSSNFEKVAKFESDFVASRYNEVYQNKRILNGSSIGFFIIAFGIFLESLNVNGMLKLIGIIGAIGSVIIGVICPLISVKIQSKINLRIMKAVRSVTDK